jgi:hypothetical protein
MCQAAVLFPKPSSLEVPGLWKVEGARQMEDGMLSCEDCKWESIESRKDIGFVARQIGVSCFNPFPHS